MAGILPDAPSGGLIIRDAAGNCTPQTNVVNAYCPPASFTSTCAITALPSDCTARITPAQINAIVSELMSFAVCLDPTGSWDCAALNNLCDAFTAWAAINVSGIIISDTAPPTPKHGTLWWESDTGSTHIWYDDGNSSQWVQIAPGSGGGGSSTSTDFVLKTGDTMSGPLNIPMAPVAPIEAANKAYVDSVAGIPLGGLPGQALVINAASVPTWGAPIDGGTY